jgi:hypothetical protein
MIDHWVEVWIVDRLGLFVQLVGVGWLHDVDWDTVDERGLVVITETGEEIIRTSDPS